MAWSTQFHLHLVSLWYERTADDSSIICIVLEIVIWTVPHLVTNAVLYSIIGIFLGPMYPIVMMVVLDVLPPELHAGTIGWCASLGQAGSAIMPL